MIESWRWFVRDDHVTPSDARLAEASGIVTALHEKYDGRAWTTEKIAALDVLVRDADFTWSVCRASYRPPQTFASFSMQCTATQTA